jgi:type I restriction enzyme M protein
MAYTPARMARIPKHAVLEVLSRPRLAELARLSGVGEPRNKRDLIGVLAGLPDDAYSQLLARLTAAELRAIARLHRLPELQDPAELAAHIDLDGEAAADPSADPAPESPPTLHPAVGSATQIPPPATGHVDLDDDDLPPNVMRLRRKEPTPTTRAQPRRGGDLGFEATLWQAADKLRSNMDAAEYKHVVLGLIFLKYISDAFEQRRQELPIADREDPAAYRRARVFWVPAPARWATVAGARSLGKAIDDAMAARAAHNASLVGVLPPSYQRPGLDGTRLSELVKLIGSIGLVDQQDRDILGRVYEYFLTRFASAEGKNGGQFYTPRSVVRLLVAMLAPTPGSSVYDPACGSGGMFVQSERFLVEHGGKHGDLKLFGQESNPTTWRLARMNLAIRGIDGNLGPEHADSFLRDQHPELRADYVLANPPFNTKDWGAQHLQNDPRWRFGVPPAQNANFAWVQHILHHTAPQGFAGFVLANGAMTASTAGEGEIRKAIVRADLIDCMVALPGQLFYSTQIPVSLWILAKDRADPRYRDRRGQILMIDARDTGVMVDRIHRELRDEEIERISAAYHAWRGDHVAGAKPARYEDVPGLCRSVTQAEIARLGGVLAPGRYVGPPAPPTPLRPFVDELAEIDRNLRAQIARGAELDSQISGLLDHLSQKPPERRSP